MVRTPGGSEQRGESGREVVEVRHVRKDVVGGHQVGAAMLGHDRLGGIAAEKVDHCGDPPFHRHLGDVGGRLDAEAGNLRRDRVLQQVPIVAGYLKHEAGAAEVEPRDHRVHVPLGMLDPAVGVRAEVGVVGKDRFAAHIFMELHQPALIADVGVQRVERLHRVQLVGAKKALAERAHAEVHEGVDQGGGAGAAGSGRHRRPMVSGVPHGLKRQSEPAVQDVC